MTYARIRFPVPFGAGLALRTFIENQPPPAAETMSPLLMKDPTMKTRTIYLPSPSDIAAAAKRIQSSWSDDERRVRQQVAKRRQASLSRSLVSFARTQSAA